MRHGFIGYGNLAKAVYRGIKKTEESSFGYYSTSNKHTEIPHFDNIAELVAGSDAIWLTVKPQNLDDVLDKLKNQDLSNKVIVSAVAGKNIPQIENGINAPVIRIMTNLAVEFGSAVTAYQTNNIDSELVLPVIQLLKKLGILFKLPEKDFDLFTAIFGSGPAFFLKFLDVQRNKILKLGIEHKDVNTMLSGLLYGTADFYKAHNENCSIDNLICQIASKNGTTEAGLKYLTENNIDILFENVIEITQKRSGELSK